MRHHIYNHMQVYISGEYMPQALLAQSPSVRVNIKTAVNNAMIRREKRHGKEYIIVPSATLPDDVVMNRILYPASEIEKGYKTLDRTFAPAGHPKIDGKYVSALEPEAINNYYVGAHNENVRRENGRVFLDKAIDVEVAGRTEKGRRLLEAINKGEPIHTSTGVYFDFEEVSHPDYDKIAKNLFFDHDAILDGEEGAATPMRGVGVFVNSDDSFEALIAVSKDPEENKKHTILAINSVVPNACDSYEQDVDWAAKYLIEAIERSEKAKKSKGFIDKITSMVRQFMGTEEVSTEANGLNNNGNEETTMPITEEQFKALEEKVTALSTNAENIAKSVNDAVADAVSKAVKPLADQLESFTANSKAKEEAERTELVAKIVANGTLEEADAKELTTNALRKLAAKAPGSAAAISGAPATNADDYSKGYGEDYDFGVPKEAK